MIKKGNKMTKFENSKFKNPNFQYDGTYLKYDGKFVARFKYGGMVAFKKFLRDNFTVEEYFDLLDSGMTPVGVLETKGYVSPTAAKILKMRGYPATQKGLSQYLTDKRVA